MPWAHSYQERADCVATCEMLRSPVHFFNFSVGIRRAGPANHGGLSSSSSDPNARR